MKIHEYQAKEIFRRFGIPTPEGRLASSADEARAAAVALGGEVVVKAQVHAGGRGKGGGIRKAADGDQAFAVAGEILGRKLVTPQTGEAGRTVRRLLVEQATSIESEYYVGLVLDREASRVAVIASPEGGVEIEQVASEHPEKIFTERVDPLMGLMPYQARRLAYALGFSGKPARAASKIFLGLYRAFVETDASLAEINPLVLAASSQVLALDAKMNFDDSALYRHPEVAERRDEEEEAAWEREAREHRISYVSLEGDIGCLVNGAGLAMATMDIIKHEGGEPANFLDVGGGADAAQVTAAFKLILGDEKVKAILVNIFGGIMRCDTIANGILAAATEVGIGVPLVVRLEGTNVKEGKALLETSDLSLVTASDMADAARKVVAAAKGKG